MSFLIHAKHAEGVNEIRPGIAAPIGYPNIEGYWGRSSSRNLKRIEGLLNVGCSWQVIDARRVINRTRRGGLKRTSLESSSARINDFEYWQEGIVRRILWFGELAMSGDSHVDD